MHMILNHTNIFFISEFIEIFSYALCFGYPTQLKTVFKQKMILYIFGQYDFLTDNFPQLTGVTRCDPSGTDVE